MFDKTGTLTAGKPAVVEVRPLPAGMDLPPLAAADELLLLAAAVERGSTHPLARAIAGAAAGARGGNGATSSSDSDGSGAGYAADEGSFVQEPGSGVTATVAARRVAVGTLEWVTREAAAQQLGGGTASSPAPLRSLDQQEAEEAAAAAASAAASTSAAAAAVAAVATQPGHILVYVGIDGQLAGAIEIADELRADAAHTVQQLKVCLPWLGVPRRGGRGGEWGARRKVWVALLQRAPSRRLASLFTSLGAAAHGRAGRDAVWRPGRHSARHRRGGGHSAAGVAPSCVSPSCVRMAVPWLVVGCTWTAVGVVKPRQPSAGAARCSGPFSFAARPHADRVPSLPFPASCSTCTRV